MFATIIAIISAAVTAVMGTLYFTKSGNSKKTEESSCALMEIKPVDGNTCTPSDQEKISALQQEVEKLKVINETQAEELLPISTERILAYLQKEKGWSAEVKDSDEDKDISFQIGDTNYRLRVASQPTVVISLGYDMENSGVDWDILHKAAFSTSQELMMVKFHIWEGKAYDMYIVSRNHSMHNLKLSLDRYLSLLGEAQRLLYHHYNDYSAPAQDSAKISNIEALKKYMMQSEGVSKEMVS
ncbi:MAG: hypothetical protein HUJ67_07180 [Ruminiclostridium sp.]|nr:hypothetical protein [Ruminiclostridium sp.]